MEENKRDFIITPIIDTPCRPLFCNNVSFDEWILENLHKRNKDNPFRVVLLGQPGVGKSTTVEAVFSLNNYVSAIVEGTTDIVEKVFPMRDGFSLSIYDMPILNNDVEKNLEYEKMCKKILPKCDVIVYVIDAHSKNLDEDCRILKEFVLPICNTNSLRDNLILAFNKIDTIGETENPNDPELRWDIINNCPTEKLKKAIKVKLNNLVEKLIDEQIVGCADSIQPEQVVFYSAVFNYNLGDFLKAITKAGKRGWIWTSTVGLERIGKWSDKRLG